MTSPHVPFRWRTDRLDLRHGSVAGLRIVKHGVKEERNILFSHHAVIHDVIPDLVTALGILHRFGQDQFFEYTRLAPYSLAAGAGADDVHAYLTAGIATEPRPVLDEDHLRAIPRRGKGCTHSSHATTGNQDIRLILTRDIRISVFVGEKLGPSIRRGRLSKQCHVIHQQGARSQAEALDECSSV